MAYQMISRKLALLTNFSALSGVAGYDQSQREFDKWGVAPAERGQHLEISLAKR